VSTVVNTVMEYSEEYSDGVQMEYSDECSDGYSDEYNAEYSYEYSDEYWDSTVTYPFLACS
jgi:hypothetical protein